MLVISCWVVLLLLGSDAGRVRRKSNGEPTSTDTMKDTPDPTSTDTTQGTPGIVSLLYTFGSPAVAGTSLTNFSGCFAGKRTLTMQEGDTYDAIGLIGRLFRYKNAMQSFQTIDVDTNEVKVYPCNEDTAKLPNGKPGPFSLHFKETYGPLIANSSLCPFEKAMGFFAEVTGFEKDQTVAKQGVESQGWNLVASALHDGGFIIGGSQVVHLIQHPETLDCVITFQGSQSRKDWYGNFPQGKMRFCGRTEKVHRGIAKVLKLATESDDYVSMIKPKLPQCGRVITVGQSQGAASAELFAACANQPNPPTDDRFYKLIGWIRGTPTKLPSV